ncbi:hypothetical protein LX32DRAFT_662279 [Colletotrichum zoysiae]|uniref:Uncharacterized protein n=1 Tax=Colletotrichum zoysiae TaxID=1216348 RepID=A0AAD9HM35_9PEZI|nr:hypothetical protein LX32DRAFT_662279 [Colletotrichum zoysiae]
MALVTIAKNFETKGDVLPRSSLKHVQRERAPHLCVFCDVVVPSFGIPTPKAKIKPLLPTMGRLWSRLVVLPRATTAVIRYTFETLGDTAGSAEDPVPRKIGRSLKPIFTHLSSDVDLQWYKQVMKERFVTPEEAVAARQNMPPHFERRRGGTASDLAFALIPKLQSFGDELAATARKLQKYLAACKELCLVEMMVIDCIDLIKASVKIYARGLSNSKSVLADVFTLGGTQTDEAILKGVETAEKTCHRLLEEPQRINIKAHLPWGHGQTARISDAQTIENFTQVLSNLDMCKSAEKFHRGALATAELPGGDYTKPGGLFYVSHH